MSIDVIGPLYDPPSEEGGEPVLLPGYHVNVTPDEMTPELEAFRVEPNPLRQVWAGDDPANPQWTVPLRFADEAGARAVLGLDGAE